MFRTSVPFTGLCACVLISLCCPKHTGALELPRLNWQPRSDWLDVRQFGAKGDGRADDTQALQKAFDKVKHGSTIYLPRGTYRVTETIKLTGPATGVLAPSAEQRECLLISRSAIDLPERPTAVVGRKPFGKSWI